MPASRPWSGRQDTTSVDFAPRIGAVTHRVPAPDMRTYQLLIELARPQWLQIGCLGEFHFPRGRYVYTGSAKCNLAARVARHLSQAKRVHWHIDYLLAVKAARVIGVRYFATGECAVNAATRGAIVAAGFGASDCRAGCGSHLKHIGLPTPKSAKASGVARSR
jgi:Uri superfamily endonuclease